MSLIQLDEVTLEFGDQKIFAQTSFSLEETERVCLIGRNGAGKSTLLRLIMGEQEVDSGEIQNKRHLRISQLHQQLPQELDSRVFDVVMDGLALQKKLMNQFEALSNQAMNDDKLREIEDIQQQIEASGGWNLDQKVETVITQLNLPHDKRLSELSGGWRRRVALGKALVSMPDVLLLDEPTNHLDISTIEWLENRIRSYPGSVIFISHDRLFVQNLATRIVELDRGQLLSWPGGYQNYLKLKQKANQEEDQHNKLFDKRLAEEEAWIRQGIKARRTRNEGRVRALEAMREEVSTRIKRQKKAKFTIGEAEKSGRKVIEAYNISHAFQGQQLLKNFKLKIMRGDRIGLIGNNGVGKSTLLKILLGDLQPDSGVIKVGTSLKIGYFDQTHRELALDKSVAHNVADGKDYIKVNGKERHIIGHMKNFLFTPDRAMTPVKALSGGERNRVLLAKLFAQETNFLILDEPTNDLDVEMLEVLEEQLVEYNGTLILVSHDRDFLDKVVSSTLVFEADGEIQHYPGGYSDWLRRGKALQNREDAEFQSINDSSTQSNDCLKDVGKKKKKLSYKLQRELDSLPEKIDILEKHIAELTRKTEESDFYTQDHQNIEPVLAELGQKQRQLDEMIDRWSHLEVDQS